MSNVHKQVVCFSAQCIIKTWFSVQDSEAIWCYLLSGARARHRGRGRPHRRWWSGAYGWSRAALRLSGLHTRPVRGGLGRVRGAERVADQPGPQPYHFCLNKLKQTWISCTQWGGGGIAGFQQTVLTFYALVQHKWNNADIWGFCYLCLITPFLCFHLKSLVHMYVTVVSAVWSFDFAVLYILKAVMRMREIKVGPC